MVTVYGYLLARDGTAIPESEWLRDLDGLLGRGLLVLDDLTVRVAIDQCRGGRGEIEDLMEPTVQNLCLRSIPSLLDEQNYSFTYWDSPGVMRMQPGGDGKILVADDQDFAPTEFPKSQLIGALLNYAGRIIGFMRCLNERYPAYNAGAVPYFEELHRDALNNFYGRTFGEP